MEDYKKVKRRKNFLEHSGILEEKVKQVVERTKSNYFTNEKKGQENKAKASKITYHITR